MVTEKVDSSHISVTIQWTLWQARAHLRDLSVNVFWNNEIMPNAA